MIFYQSTEKALQKEGNLLMDFSQRPHKSLYSLNMLLLENTTGLIQFQDWCKMLFQIVDALFIDRVAYFTIWSECLPVFEDLNTANRGNI